ncbi:RNA-binding protein [bacterium]|nr:RNA-binding protein [bacterium]
MSLNNPNKITSLYVSGISPGTKEKYIRSIFSKLGQVHKINYHGKTTAYVHMRCCFPVVINSIITLYH